MSEKHEPTVCAVAGIGVPLMVRDPVHYSVTLRASDGLELTVSVQEWQWRKVLEIVTEFREEIGPKKSDKGGG